MGVHLRNSGSKAGRLLQCPAFISRVEKLPRVQTTNAAAQRGTELHEIQEYLRKNSLLPSEYDKPLSEEYKQVTAEVYKKTDEVLDMLKIENLILEPFLTADEETGGYIDLLGFGENTALILDYKMGTIPVSAQNNPQGLFYFWMAKENGYLDNIENFYFAIIQPKRKPDVFKFTIDLLDEFVLNYRHAVELSHHEHPPATTGKECKWCEFAPLCPERKQLFMQQLNPDYKGKLNDSIRVAKEIKAWAESVEKYAKKMLETGEQLQDWKLVKFRTNRTWKKGSEEELRKIIHPEYMKLPTPADVTKKLKIDLSRFIEEKEIYTIAEQEDKRPRIVITGNDVLNNNLINN